MYPAQTLLVYDTSMHSKAVGKLFVVPAGALPVPVSDNLYRGYNEPSTTSFASVGLSSASIGQNRQHNCFLSALCIRLVNNTSMPSGLAFSHTRTERRFAASSKPHPAIH
jgi:hypothetical protein